MGVLVYSTGTSMTGSASHVCSTFHNTRVWSNSNTGERGQACWQPYQGSERAISMSCLIEQLQIAWRTFSSPPSRLHVRLLWRREPWSPGWKRSPLCWAVTSREASWWWPSRTTKRAPKGWPESRPPHQMTTSSAGWPSPTRPPIAGWPMSAKGSATPRTLPRKTAPSTEHPGTLQLAVSVRGLLGGGVYAGFRCSALSLWAVALMSSHAHICIFSPKVLWLFQSLLWHQAWYQNLNGNSAKKQTQIPNHFLPNADNWMIFLYFW